MTRTPEPEALRAGLLGPDPVELALSINDNSCRHYGE